MVLWIGQQTVAEEYPSPKLRFQEERNSRVWRNGDDAKQWHLPNSLLDCVHLLVSGLLRKPFAPSGLLLFREQPIPARGRSSQSTDMSSIFYRSRITKKRMAGVSSLCLCCCTRACCLPPKRCVSDADRGSRREGRGAPLFCESRQIITRQGNPQATMSRTHLPDALDTLCNFTVVAWEPGRITGEEAILLSARQ